MRSAYDSSTANFSGMTGSRDLWPDTIQHAAFIEVDEESTEAHAATGAAIAGSHGPTMTSTGDFFVIRERPTGAILAWVASPITRARDRDPARGPATIPGPGSTPADAR